MNHKNVRIIEDLSPYQIVEIQLISESKQEEEDILVVGAMTENYLAMSLSAVEIISYSGNKFIIRRAKNNSGFGK